MDTENKYYKHSNTGNIIHHIICWWTHGRRPVKYHEYHYSLMTDTKSISGAPDLTGYVPISEKLYTRLVAKLQRVRRNESKINLTNQIQSK